ncbi:MAG: hypothetical protein ACYS7Y_36575 [Planctomycetota bacterium]
MPKQTGVWLLPNVRMRPEIAGLWAAKIASDVFQERGIPCAITSWWREDDHASLHGYHAAVDIDAMTPVNETMLITFAGVILERLGGEDGPFQVIYHAGHIHIEYDPTRTGVAPYTEKKPCKKSSAKSSGTGSKAKRKGSKAALDQLKAPAAPKSATPASPSAGDDHEKINEDK